MAEEQATQQDMAEFERSRQQLFNVSSQKQQMQFQSTTMEKAIGVLEKTKEKKAYKAVGNILILSDVSDMEKELKEQKETIDLRVKSMQKQEDIIVQKLNKLKSKIEGSGAKAEAETEQPTKSNKKNSKQ